MTYTNNSVNEQLMLDDVVRPFLFDDDYEDTIPDLFACDEATPDSLENRPEQPGYTETAPSTPINQDAPEQSDVEPIAESDTDSAEAQTITPKPTKNPFGVPASWQEVDADAIIGQLRALFRPGDVFEVCWFPKGSKTPKSGWFDYEHIEQVPDAVRLISGDSAGVYVCINPVNPDLIYRKSNSLPRKYDSSGSRSSDNDVVGRRWLMIDFDPKRLSGIAATDGEKGQALETCDTVSEALREAGFPEPVTIDSGNGFQLLYPCAGFGDKEDSAIAEFIRTLAAEFDNEYIGIDKTVHNKARLGRLAGTINRKGEDTLERPHRPSQLISVPQDRETRITPDMLATYMGLHGASSTTRSPAKQTASKQDAQQLVPISKNPSGFDIDRWIDTYVKDMVKPAEKWQGGRRWVFPVCPFNNAHDNGSAVLLELESGAISFRCHHNGCSDKTWNDLRAMVEKPTCDVQTAQLIRRYGHPYQINEKSGKIAGLNQRFFAAYFLETEHPVFDKDLRKFYLYNPKTGLWQTYSDEAIIAMLSDAIFAYISEAGTCPPDTCTAHLMKDILVFLRGIAAEEDPFPQGSRSFIHVANGVLEFDTSIGKWVLKPFSPEYRSLNRTEVPYDPEAACPRFVHNLLEPALDADSIKIIQLYTGQCLIGRNISQTFLCVTGTPGGGKGTLVNVIEKLIGPQNCTELRTRHLNDRFEMSRYYEKTLICGKDVPPDFLLKQGSEQIKSLTGNDAKSPEIKGVSGCKNIIGCFNIIVTANAKLRLRVNGDAGAWKRRLLWVSYDNEAPSEVIRDFDDKLIREEGSGILNWALEGARELLMNGGRIITPKAHDERIEGLLTESNAIYGFLKTCVTKTGDKNDTITSEKLVQEYERYCHNNDWDMLPDRRARFELKEAMLTVHHIGYRHDVKCGPGNLVRGFVGVTLAKIRPTTTEPPAQQE